MKIVFAATGDIAIPAFEALVEKNLVSMLLTAPDQRGKRGNKLIPPKIKEIALSFSIPVFQPERIGGKEREYIVAEAKADTLVSFCYGKIFGPKFLSCFSKKYNIHPSILPKYRGCAPLYATILNRDGKYGISIQDISEKVDEGDVYSSMEFPLDGKEDRKALEEIVSIKARDMVSSFFSNPDAFSPHRQEGDGSYTNFIRKEDGILDFSKSAEELHALIRALYPWPKGTTTLDGCPFYLLGVSSSVFAPFEKTNGEIPGTIVSYEDGKGLKVATGNGYLYVTRVQEACRKEMDAKSFVNGRKDIFGKVLGE